MARAHSSVRDHRRNLLSGLRRSSHSPSATISSPTTAAGDQQFDESAGLTVTTFASGIVQPVDLQVGLDGALYYLARDRAATPGGCAAFVTAEPGAVHYAAAGQSHGIGGPVSNVHRGSLRTAPLSYRWQRNGTAFQARTAPATRWRRRQLVTTTRNSAASSRTALARPRAARPCSPSSRIRFRFRPW